MKAAANLYRRIILSTGLGLVLALGPSQGTCQESVGPPVTPAAWKIQLRNRVETSPASRRFHTVQREEVWQPDQTAIIVCDVWDLHHSGNAVRRVKELAPRLNLVLQKGRENGATIIHAPSDCMAAYTDHPGRLRAQQTPRAADLPNDIAQWCTRIDSEDGTLYPLDQSDGGDDDDPIEHAAWVAELKQMGRDPAAPWKQQSPLITIDAGHDYVTDNGQEVWNILQSRSIKHIVIAGVHTNMCVLGRPFGLRQLARHGKQVVLMRDLTDTMYNPASWPYVNHHTGTDRIVEYIEKYVCATCTSDQILGGVPFRFSTDNRPLVAILMAEDEYETDRTLPRFAAEYLGRDFRVQLIFADDNKATDIPGLEALRTADIAILSVRRRILPKAQLDIIREFVRSGKPLIGIRTASHAFCLRDQQGLDGGEAWPEFDAQVWGGSYSGHYGEDSKPSIQIVASGRDHAILKDIAPQPFLAGGSLYKTSPVAPSAQLLFEGHVAGQVAEPVAWTFQRADGGKSFYTSLGHKLDFENPAFIRLLFNAIFWGLGKEPLSLPENATLLRPTDSNSGLDENSDELMALQNTDIPPLVPSRNAPTLKVAEDLELDLVLQEPLVANPLYLNFDERGRLWVVQYRQYPWPAGLRLISRDNVWRNVYDPPFPPPPPHADDSPFRGKDRITIHEDADGDGRYESNKVFLDGLNLATSALKGRGGVFVMNPPYLLFYADANEDDVPDSATPRVLLSGFGIEDTHSIANSLRWGPDGWIYGAQGSTVSAAVVRHGDDGRPIAGENPVHSLGQNVWRYQPESHAYEIFAEGGGNAFGIEFDSQGRLYSGHNGGDTRGFYYIPGGYYLKNFGKHGSLSNPYAFGHYPAMRHDAVERFSHTFEIYEADALPQRYRGMLFALAPHLHYIMGSQIMSDGSSRMTKDIGKVVVAGPKERDDWFTPVDIQTGPDGALYVADWYSVQANHYRSHEGETNPTLGRIYRLRGASTVPYVPEDLRTVSGLDLAEKYLAHPNRWYRETALRLLADRRDPAIYASLTEKVLDSANPRALEALWGLHGSGGLHEALAPRLCKHPDPLVRSWTVRLLSDRGTISAETARVFSDLARSENQVEVRLQLACSAQRLATHQALPILTSLLTHSEDAGDILLPQRLWWSLVEHAGNHPAIRTWLTESADLATPLALAAKLAENLMRLYAMRETQADLAMCAELLKLAPNASLKQQMVVGFGRAFEGRAVPSLPTELVKQLSGIDHHFDLLLGIRQANHPEVTAACQFIRDSSQAEGPQIELVRALGEVQAEADITLPVLLDLLQSHSSNNIVVATLVALQHFPDERIAGAILAAYPRLEPAAQETALGILASRASWAREMLLAINQGSIEKRALSQDTRERLVRRPESDLQEAISTLFSFAVPSSADLDARIRILEAQVLQGNGSPLEGQKLFHESATCGKCHTMFGRGGNVGPDLTPYDRSNLRQMLLAIVHPSAEVREGFENRTIMTNDGQVVTGFKVEENERVLVLKSADGQQTTIAKDGIDEQFQNTTSLMPMGLLDTLDERQMCDLFAFLSSTTPPM